MKQLKPPQKRSRKKKRQEKNNVEKTQKQTQRMVFGFVPGALLFAPSFFFCLDVFFFVPFVGSFVLLAVCFWVKKRWGPLRTLLLNLGLERAARTPLVSGTQSQDRSPLESAGEGGGEGEGGVQLTS